MNDAVNATLAAGVTYLGNLNFHGTDTLTVVVDDLGNTGAGGALTDSQVVSIRVAADALRRRARATRRSTPTVRRARRSASPPGRAQHEDERSEMRHRDRKQPPIADGGKAPCDDGGGGWTGIWRGRHGWERNTTRRKCQGLGWRRPGGDRCGRFSQRVTKP